MKKKLTVQADLSVQLTFEALKDAKEFQEFLQRSMISEDDFCEEVKRQLLSGVEELLKEELGKVETRSLSIKENTETQVTLEDVE